MSPLEATEQVSEGSEAGIRRAENRHFYTICGYVLHPIVLNESVFEGFTRQTDNPYIDHKQ